MPKLSCQSWRIASTTLPGVAPAPEIESRTSGSRPAYVDSSSNCWARSGSNGSPRKLSSYPRIPGGRIPSASDSTSCNTTSMIRSRSIAIAKARRTSGSSKGGCFTLKPT